MSEYGKQIKEIAEKLAYGDSFLADRETVLSIARLKAVGYLDKKGGISGTISYNG